MSQVAGDLEDDLTNVADVEHVLGVGRPGVPAGQDELLDPVHAGLAQVLAVAERGQLGETIDRQERAVGRSRLVDLRVLAPHHRGARDEDAVDHEVDGERAPQGS